MTDVSQSLIKKKIDEESDSLVPSIGREDITVIKGIGPSMAIKLRNQGFGTISSLAETNPKKLAGRIEGIGVITAQKFVEQARILKQSKNLNNFTHEENTPQKPRPFEIIKDEHKKVREDSSESEPEPESDFGVLKYVAGLSPKTAPVIEEFIAELEAGQLEDEFEYEEVDDELSEPEELEQETYDEEEEEIPKHSHIVSDPSVNRNDLEEPLKTEYLDEIETEIPQPIDNDPLIIMQELADPKSTLEIFCHKDLPRSPTSEEMVDHIQIQEMSDSVAGELESLEFLVIKKTPELRAIFTGIDLIAIKLVRVKEYLDFIYIIPVKICPLKGNIILSNDKVDYHPVEESEDYQYNLNRVVASYLQALSLSEQNIFENCLHEGNLFQFITHYLHIDISLKKTLMHETLFFHSGPLQYKLLIEPLLVCKNKVGFTERLIPFAYHKSSNIHVVELPQVSKLMQYLDQKYFLIETYTEKETAFSKYKKSSDLFMKHLRLLSIPFIGYGFVLLLFLLFQSYSVISLLVNLGYGVLALYGIIFSYIYLKYFQEKSLIRNDLSTPYYQKRREFDETTLILINEELSPKLMEQFVFESVGNHKVSKTISKVEQANAETYLEHKVTERAVKNANLFESEVATQSSTKNFSSSKNQLKDRYSSFLED